MILLTDEQIRSIFPQYKEDGFLNLSDIVGNATKAQLKKVADEGERLGVLGLTEEKGIALARTCRRMYEFWQALLKEVE